MCVEIEASFPGRLLANCRVVANTHGRIQRQTRHHRRVELAVPFRYVEVAVCRSSQVTATDAALQEARIDLGAAFLAVLESCCEREITTW